MTGDTLALSPDCTQSPDKALGMLSYAGWPGSGRRGFFLQSGDRAGHEPSLDPRLLLPLGLESLCVLGSLSLWKCRLRGDWEFSGCSSAMMTSGPWRLQGCIALGQAPALVTLLLISQ